MFIIATIIYKEDVVKFTPNNHIIPIDKYKYWVHKGIKTIAIIFLSIILIVSLFFGITSFMFAVKYYQLSRMQIIVLKNYKKYYNQKLSEANMFKKYYKSLAEKRKKQLDQFDKELIIIDE